MDIDIGIAYEANLDDAEKALMTLCADKRVHKEPAPQFLVVSYGDSAITVRLRLYADYSQYFRLNWDLNRRLKETLEAHNIEIPFPQLVISKKSDDMS
jgi:small conductance mechanosensitive channel